MALNDAGNRAIVGSSGGGAVAYEYDGATWNLISAADGTGLPGPTGSTSSGVTVALSSHPTEGDRAIVGSDGGGAVVYSYPGTGTTWNLISAADGSGLPGPTGSMSSGVTVALSSHYFMGDRAIVGSDGGGAVAYSFAGGTTWTPISAADGSGLPGSTGGSNRGISVSLDAAGDRAIVGSNGGGAVVYSYPGTGTTWNLISAADGSDLRGRGTDNGAGVALNDTGDRAIVNGRESGAVVYSYPGTGTTWTPISAADGSDLLPPPGGFTSRKAVALNDAGDRAIVGANEGGAVVYQYS